MGAPRPCDLSTAVEVSGALPGQALERSRKPANSAETVRVGQDQVKGSAWTDVRAVAALLSWALLLAASFPPLNFTWLAWIALVPWAWALQCRAHPSVLYPAAFLAAVLFHPLALDWLHGRGSVPWLTSLTSAKGLYLSIILSVTCTAIFALARIFVTRVSLPMIVALPLVWVAAEFARRYVPSVLDGAGFPWLQLGHTQVDQRTLVQIADLGGVWAVTAVIAMVNGAIFDTLRLVADRRFLALGTVAVSVLLFLGAVYTYGAWRIASTDYDEGPVICLMPKHLVSDLTREHAAGADILLWSETAVGAPLVIDGPVEKTQINHEEQMVLREAFEGLAEFARSTGVSLAIGCIRLDLVEEARKFNSIAFFSGGEGFAGCYDKVRPVPWGEFVPTQIPGLPGRGKGYVPGTRYPVFRAPGRGTETQWRVATTVCYDTCFPEVYGRLVRADGGPPDVFLAASNEGSDESGLLKSYLLSLTRFRAIETRRAQARCVEAGWSALVTSVGDVIVQTGGDGRRFLLPPAPIDRRVPPYARWGDTLPAAAWTLSLVIIVVAIIFRKIRHCGGIFLPPPPPEAIKSRPIRFPVSLS